MEASAPLVEILRLNTDLLHNALDGVSDADAGRRIAGTNPAAFLAAHLVDARHCMAGLLGAPLADPFGDALRDVRSADDVKVLPPLAEILSAGDPSLGAGIAFLMQHESYHIGQMALLRRQLGYPAMTYRRREP